MSDSMFHQFPPYLSELSKDNGKGIGDDSPQQGEDTYRSGCEGQTLNDDHEFREGSPLAKRFWRCWKEQLWCWANNTPDLWHLRAQGYKDTLKNKPPNMKLALEVAGNLEHDMTRPLQERNMEDGMSETGSLKDEFLSQSEAFRVPY